MFESRIARFREALPEELDAALITSAVSRRYFSGLNTSAGYLLISRKSAYFFADFRYIEMVRNEARHLLAVRIGGEFSLGDVLTVENVSAIGFEDVSMTVAELERFKKENSAVEFFPLGDAVEKLRWSKDRKEVMEIMAAQNIADKAFVETLNFIREGRTEREIRDYLDACMVKEGAQGPGFPTIALTGAKTSMPHGVPTDRKVRRGDFVLLDFGAEVGGYRSDMTRTVAVGEPDEKAAEVYDIVLRAQLAALGAVRAGVVGREIDRIARGIISEAGYGEAFGHALGHSVGLEIHERPNFSPKSEDVIPQNCVITVEPGIYLPGEFGVRIEDIIIVTGPDYENMTASPKGLLVL